MLLREAGLQFGVLSRLVFVRNEVIPKIQMPLHFRIIRLITVNLMRARVSALGKVAPPRDAVLAHRTVTKLDHSFIEGLGPRDIPDNRHYVDNGLCTHTRNRRAANVMKREEIATKNSRDARSLLAKPLYPCGIVCHDYDLPLLAHVPRSKSSGLADRQRIDPFRSRKAQRCSESFCCHMG